METTDHLTSTSAGDAFPPSAKKRPGSRIGRRRLVFGGGATAIGIALALGLRWHPVAALTLLLVLLPFGAAMVVWRKRVKRGRQMRAVAVPNAPSDTDAAAALIVERKRQRRIRDSQDDHVFDGIMLERYHGKF